MAICKSNFKNGEGIEEGTLPIVVNIWLTSLTKKKFCEIL